MATILTSAAGCCAAVVRRARLSRSPAGVPTMVAWRRRWGVAQVNRDGQRLAMLPAAPRRGSSVGASRDAQPGIAADAVTRAPEFTR